MRTKHSKFGTLLGLTFLCNLNTHFAHALAAPETLCDGEAVADVAAPAAEIATLATWIKKNPSYREMVRNYAMGGPADLAAWEFIFKQINVISARGGQKALSPEGWLAANTDEVSRIVGQLLVIWQSGAVKPVGRAILSGTQIRVDGRSHADSWIVNAVPTTKTDVVEVSGFLDAQHSAVAFLNGGRERVRGLLRELVDAKTIELNGIEFPKDKILVQINSAKFPLSEILKDVSVAVKGDDWTTFEKAYRALLSPSFFRGIVPQDKSLGQYPLSEPAVVMAPMSADDLRDFAVKFFQDSLNVDLTAALAPKWNELTMRRFGPSASAKAEAKLRLLTYLRLPDGKFNPVFTTPNGLTRLANQFYLGIRRFPYTLAKTILVDSSFNALGWNLSDNSTTDEPATGGRDESGLTAKAPEPTKVAPVNSPEKPTKAPTGYAGNGVAPFHPSAPEMKPATSPATAAKEDKSEPEVVAPKSEKPKATAKKASKSAPKSNAGSASGQDSANATTNEVTYSNPTPAAETASSTYKPTPIIAVDPRIVRERLLLPDGNVRGEYEGSAGAESYARRYQQKDADAATRAAKEALGSQYPRLRWASVTRADKVYDFLFKDGKVRDGVAGFSGLAKVARENYGNDVKLARKEITDGLSPQNFALLGYGAANDLDVLKSQLLGSDQQFLPQFRGPRGQARFSTAVEEPNKGNMKTAYFRVKTNLPEAFKTSGWEHAFAGTGKSFLEQRARAFDGNDKIHPNVIGNEGCKRLAAKHFGGNTEATKRAMKDVLSAKEYNQTLWDEPTSAE